MISRFLLPKHLRNRPHRGILRENNEPVPGIAPAAKQMGQYAGRRIIAAINGTDIAPFRYRHEGDLATIGRRAAVVKVGSLTLTGFAGWVFWGVAHIYFLIGLRNRFTVAFNWLWDWATFQSGARFITGYNPGPEHAHTASGEASRETSKNWRSESEREGSRDWA